MELEPDILCWGDDHKKLIYYITFPSILLWNVTVPLIFYFYLSKVKSLLKKRGLPKYCRGTLSVVALKFKPRTIASLELDYSSRSSSKTAKTEGIQFSKTENLFFFLTREFKDRYYYWTLVEFFFQFVLLITSKLIGPLNEIQKKVVLLAYFFIIFLSYSYFQPYNSSLFSILRLSSIGVIIFSIGTTNLVNNESQSDTGKILSTFLLLFANAGFYLILVVLIFIIFMGKKSNKFKRLSQRLTE